MGGKGGGQGVGWEGGVGFSVLQRVNVSDYIVNSCFCLKGGVYTKRESQWKGGVEGRGYRQVA